jgi:DNA-directed RNA polymerase I, II, and III subunit RPABC1
MQSIKEKINNPLHSRLDLDSEEIRTRVLANIVKMIRYRGYLDKQKWTDNVVTQFAQQRSDSNIYKIPLDTPMPSEQNFDNKSIYVKIVAQKINSISSSPVVNDFLKTHTDKYKLLVFESISDKAVVAFSDNSKIEVFEEKFLLQDLMSHYASPVYHVLSEEEVKELKNSYNIDNKTIPKLFLRDPAAKYLALKRGQIVRVTRNSEYTGLSVCYRRVK